MSVKIFASILLILFSFKNEESNRGEVSSYHSKYIWSETGRAFVPNYIMIDMIANEREMGSANDLSKITEEQLDAFIDEFMVEHGFNGLHVPVYGQWFHIGDNVVKITDTIIDQKTFDQLKMIINKVYEAGGSTHLWLWGDDQRSQTSASLKGGIMGETEKYLLDEIHRQLNPLNGWTMGYGFDLWEWVNEEQLRQWHNYLCSKPGWNHLLGARASKNEFNQIYEGLDYSGYEYHKPWYNDLVKMISERPDKPSFSEDRYRIRYPSRYPEKDYNEEETLRGLWHHTMAGGVAAIWGNLEGNGIYSNKEAIKCFFTFWNDHNRFTKDMQPDSTLSEALCLHDNDYFIFYMEQTSGFEFNYPKKSGKIIAVDTRLIYREVEMNQIFMGENYFEAPYQSDWAIFIE